MGCAPQRTAIEPVRTVVTVNGTVIDHDAISREVQNHPATSPAESWTAATLALVIREVLLQRAAVLGLEALETVEADGRRVSPDEALVRAVVETDVRLPEADSQSCRRYYERNRERFRTPTLYEAAHILIAAPRTDRARWASASARATAIREAIVSGEVDFATAARDASACPSRLNDGRLGQVGEGDTTPEFDAALAGLQPGETVRAPVASRFGFHIIRLDHRIEGRVVPFEAVEPQVAAYLTDGVRQRVERQYIEALLGNTDVKGFDWRAARVVMAGLGQREAEPVGQAHSA